MGLVRDDRHDTIHIYLSEQECIPVGCVPPAAVAIWGSPHQAPPGADTPQDQTPPWDQASPRSRPPRTRQPPPPGTGTPCEQND